MVAQLEDVDRAGWVDPIAARTCLEVSSTVGTENANPHRNANQLTLHEYCAVTITATLALSLDIKHPAHT